MAHGLQTHIWKNNRKSILLLLTYPLLILGIVWICSYVIGVSIYEDNTTRISTLNYQGKDVRYYDPVPDLGESSDKTITFANTIMGMYWPIILTAIMIWFLISYFFHSSMIRRLSHAKLVGRTEEPELYNMVETLCISQGMVTPRINIIESHARNAFASGIDQRSFAVTVTRGLMNSLAKDELEAVIAHELTHIQNRDVRLLMVTVIFTGMIGFAAQLAWSNIRHGFIYSAKSRKGGGIIVMIAIAAILWLGYMATLFTRFAISRKREYMADAGAVMMTKNPGAMMRALMRISGKAQIPETTGDIMMMCVENRMPFMGLFRTHPLIETRIQALSEMTNTPVPDPMSLPPIGLASKNGIVMQSKKKRKNPWLTRGRRKLPPL